MRDEPGKIVAGDSVEWTVQLADHPAPDWVLHYAMFNKDANQSFDAIADGANHKVQLTKTATATWAAGRYDWASYVTSGAERVTVSTGVFIIVADPSSGTPFDGRSHARKMVDAIEATLEGTATKEQLDILKGQYGDRAIERDPDLLRKLRKEYRREIKDENSMNDMKSGYRQPKNTKIIFNK